ncbi:MAG TPA: NCS2 family permease [Clostridiaceae bacterium]|jgi:AGZA family xanthine/uracil permease-like MFS transporter|nr:NCS2 family permease [Clostridiaceae bacterium]
MKKFFKLEQEGVTIGNEIMAGATTFMTMAYVLIVQPSSIIGFGNNSITDIAGVTISREGLLLTCALVTGLITLLMALYTNMPLALSTGMGSNFLLGKAIQDNAISFGGAMAIVLISGTIFLLLCIFGIRGVIVRMMPRNIKVAISATIGFFIAYLGFKDAGIGDFKTGIAMGDFTNKGVILAICTLLLIAVLHSKKVPGAVLIGMVISTIVAIPLGIIDLPTQIVSLPRFGEMKNLMFNFNFKDLLSGEALVFIFICFFSDFFSTLGTVLGVAGIAGKLDENGDLPGIEKPFLVDAIGTVVGACTGNTTVTTYVESSAGVKAGGRTGLTALTTSALFFLAMFFAPIFMIIPSATTGAALIFIGLTMISGLANIDFSSFEEAFGPIMMILFGIFNASIAAGISAGILAHVFIKVLSGKFKELHFGMYILCVPLIIYFVFS